MSRGALDTVNANAFADLRAFESELRESLKAKLTGEGVEHVMTQTRCAFERLQSINLSWKLHPENAEQIRLYEAWNTGFRVSQMRLLAVLINYFVAVEVSSRSLELPS